MFVTKTSLPRRTFLRGMGVAMGLPLLDAMVPALTVAAQTAANPKYRFGAIYVPHGMIMDQWTAVDCRRARAEADHDVAQLAFKEQMLVVSNLARPEDGFDTNHAGAPASWLTGVAPKRTDGPDFRLGVTVDQVIAGQIGQDTTFPVARSGDRGLHGAARLVRAGLQLRVCQHPELAGADVAAADGDQPARAVRADVR